MKHIGLYIQESFPFGAFGCRQWSLSEMKRLLRWLKHLGYNSAAFSTLPAHARETDDHNILEKKETNKFHFGTQLYVLSRAANRRSDLIKTIRPYLEAINRKTRLMVFLGIRSGVKAVIIDKVDSTFDIKVMSEVGMRIPLLAGSGGKALLSQLPEDEIDKILSKNKLRKFTAFSCTDKPAIKP